MKKFAFTLEKVLGFKNQTLDLLKSQLSAIQHELNLIEERIVELGQTFDKVNSELVENMVLGITSADISVYKVYLNNTSAQIRKEEDKKTLTLEKIRKKQQEIIKANIEIASLEKLKERQLEEYRKAVQKADEIELNEFIGNLTSV